jgi:hypothetical protein
MDYTDGMRGAFLGAAGVENPVFHATPSSPSALAILGWSDGVSIELCLPSVLRMLPTTSRDVCHDHFQDPRPVRSR